MANEPNMESLLRQAADKGWDFFNAPGPQDRSPAEQARTPEQERLIAIAGALWAVPEFRELVDHLVEVTLRRMTFVAQLGLTIDQAYGYGVYREGQNATTMMLLKLIAEGRKVAAPKERAP